MKWLATKALVIVIICVLVQIIFASILNPLASISLGICTIVWAMVMWLEFKNSI
jgi:hypothetical protein